MDLTVLYNLSGAVFLISFVAFFGIFLFRAAQPKKIWDGYTYYLLSLMLVSVTVQIITNVYPSFAIVGFWTVLGYSLGFLVIFSIYRMLTV